MNMTEPVPAADEAPDLEATRAEVLARVDEILPLLAENAERAETERDLPPACFEALVDSGALRLFAPRRAGGCEAGYRTYLETTCRVATACGSAAWLCFITNHGDWHTGQSTQSVQDAVWANGASDKVAVPLAPLPGWTAERVDGGTIVSGEWSYVSGSTYTKWAMVGFPKLGEDGQPVDNILGLVSLEDVPIRDTWQVSGMAATGSNTIALANTFIPDEHTLLMSDMLAHRFRTPHTREAQYQMDVGTVFHVATLIPVVALARAALDLTLARITSQPKPMAYTYYPDTTKAPCTQSAMAEAAWMIDTALEQARDTTDAIDRQARTATPFSSKERARFAMRAAQGHRLCRQGVDRLLDVQGAGAFALANPLQRLWRDMHMASRHGMSVPGLKEEVYGRSLLGAEEQQMTPIV